MAVLRSTTDFIAPGRRRINRGAVVDSNDPVVKGREHLFEDVETTVERASAAPGEKRAAKKAPAKKKAAEAKPAESSPEG